MKKENSARGSGKNRLQFEKSPYLLQHADNPVNWFPWGDEAFDKAEKEDKPIFLSIGYSTCHWCHVMEHESFEDKEVAKLMNDSFICIKVDREERPDIDNIYMQVCQMMTGSGGWPLTIIMTPGKKPFFAGTYFPKKSFVNRIGMLNLIPKIADAWKNKRKALSDSAEQITSVLNKISAQSSDKAPGKELMKRAFNELSSSYDKTYGGFGNAPKFPTPHRLLFLLRYWKQSKNPLALEMVEETLRAMRKSGIYDQLGFGFHRYSTDRLWRVPHFEKMLYDQALLSMTYLEAYQATGKNEYADTAKEIFEYVLRDMRSSEGAFYTAEDADSEGEEGKFYTWDLDELKKILTGDELKTAITFFNVERNGNFHVEATGRKNKQNILFIDKKISETAGLLKIDTAKLNHKFEIIRKKLFSVRKKRIHPHKDKKILADWNGLMIASLAMGGRILDNPEYKSAAEKAAGFILENMTSGNDGTRLFHRYKDGHRAVPGQLEDYAFVIWGLIELYEATFKSEYIQAALGLNNVLLKHFPDEENGGFFMTADDVEKLIIRPKTIYDGAIPSGNSVMMYNLLRLSGFTADPDLKNRAFDIVKSFAGMIERSPSNHSFLMTALSLALGRNFEIVIAGKPGADDTQAMISAINKIYLPESIVIFRPELTGNSLPPICKIAEFTKAQKSIGGKAAVYVCVDFACKQPVTEVKEMLKLLE